MDRRDDQKGSGLPHLYDITKEQWAITAVSFVASGLVDIATHNSTVAVVGLIATGIVAHQSNTILDMVVPGRESERVIEATGHIVDALAPIEAYEDQSAGAKLRRLFNVKSRTPEIWSRSGRSSTMDDEEAGTDSDDASDSEDLFDEPQEDLVLLPPNARFRPRAYTDDDDLPPPTLPVSGGKFVFSSVLNTFTPTLDRIYLASTTDGLAIYCAAEDLCHVALAGNTGGGKTGIMRLLMAQLCKAGAQVLLLNPHYTRYDLKHDEDWTPFEPYLVYDPMKCRDYKVIEHYLKYAAEDLLPKRLEKYAHSLPTGKPYFLVLDELPAIVRHIPKTPDYLRELLEEGRKVGIYVITAAQDFLVKTISPKNGGGSIRECYRTAYYVGGDPTTAKTLLDMPANLIPEDQLGRGPTMLRCAAVPTTKKAKLTRVPYLDNASLYRLLGPSTYNPSGMESDLQEEDVLAHPTGAQPMQLVHPVQPDATTDVSATIQKLRNAHFLDREIMRLIGMNERDYQRILAQLPATGSEGTSQDRDTTGMHGETLIERRERELWASRIPSKTSAEPNLTPFETGREASTGRPKEGLNELVEGRDALPTRVPFLSKGDDKLLPDDQHDDLIHWYAKVGNVNDALARMGITNSRYRRHAAYILEQRGLKRRA
jgi:hypothetical protein